MMNAERAAPHPGRLKWHSRRALLELDILLERFWQQQDGRLDASQARVLEDLLALEDHALWDMVCGRREAGDPQQAAFIDVLLRVPRHGSTTVAAATTDFQES